eukprot:6203304-Pleurochrysis_carterae.AAC.1
MGSVDMGQGVQGREGEGRRKEGAAWLQFGQLKLANRNARAPRKVRQLECLVLVSVLEHEEQKRATGAGVDALRSCWHAVVGACSNRPHVHRGRARTRSIVKVRVIEIEGEGESEQREGVRRLGNERNGERGSEGDGGSERGKRGRERGGGSGHMGTERERRGGRPRWTPRFPFSPLRARGAVVPRGRRRRVGGQGAADALAALADVEEGGAEAAARRQEQDARPVPARRVQG